MKQKRKMLINLFMCSLIFVGCRPDDDLEPVVLENALRVENIVESDEITELNSDIQFEFILEALNEQFDDEESYIPMPTKNTITIDGEGYAYFDAITFTEVGTFEYKVTQVIPDIDDLDDSDESIRNSPVSEIDFADKVVFTVTITVQEVNDELVVEVEAEEMIFTNSYASEKDANQDVGTDNNINPNSTTSDSTDTGADDNINPNGTASSDLAVNYCEGITGVNVVGDFRITLNQSIFSVGNVPRSITAIIEYLSNQEFNGGDVSSHHMIYRKTESDWERIPREAHEKEFSDVGYVIEPGFVANFDVFLGINNPGRYQVRFAMGPHVEFCIQ